jgi:hypothetical protein
MQMKTKLFYSHETVAVPPTNQNLTRVLVFFVHVADGVRLSGAVGHSNAEFVYD